VERRELFYATVAAAVRVGIEATGHTRWFERMLAELGHELWIGDAADSGSGGMEAEDGRAGRRAFVGVGPLIVDTPIPTCPNAPGARRGQRVSVLTRPNVSTFRRERQV
jgi:hypothetical protein